MTAPQNSYVNLKDLAEFNKYTTGLGAGAIVYVDKLDSSDHYLRIAGILFATIVVFLGVVIMSAKGRIKGDEIDYATETDAHKKTMFTIISRTLTTQMAFLLVTVAVVGYLSIAKIWNPH